MTNSTEFTRTQSNNIAINHHHPTAIVIGSGFGGLASAVRLKSLGYHVIVLEALDQPGGRARVFKEENYIFDAGPTIITTPYLFDELFGTLGKSREDYFQLTPIDPFYQVRFTDRSQFQFFSDETLLLDQIKQINPADVDGYLRLCQFSKECYRIGYEKLSDKPISRLFDMVRMTPTMIRLKAFRSIYGLVSLYIRDEHLRQILCIGPLFIGGNPHKVSAIYLLLHWIERQWGVFFPEGGVNRMIQGLVKLLKDSDVEVKTKAIVDKIIIKSGKTKGVLLTTGETLQSDIVVSNADPSVTYRELIDKKHRRKHTNARVDQKRQSPSLFVAYFGTPKTTTNISHHTIFIGENFHQELQNIYYRYSLSDKPSLYMHLPSKTSAHFAPAGYDAGYLISLFILGTTDNK